MCPHEESFLTTEPQGDEGVIVISYQTVTDTLGIPHSVAESVARPSVDTVVVKVPPDQNLSANVIRQISELAQENDAELRFELD